MLEIYTSPDYAGSLDLEFELRELGLEYRRISTAPEQAAEIAIRNGVRLVSGETAVAAYLDELRYTVENWNWFASDACYVDDSGENC